MALYIWMRYELAGF